MADYPVHTGHWVDYSKGPILGSQITVTTSVSNLLVAIIAIFITLLGGIAWTTVAYTIHQVSASRQSKDGFHHLHQTLLRNQSSPLHFVGQVIWTSFAWRKKSVSWLVPRTFILAGFALMTWAVFVVAGILLSLIATSGNVLLQSPFCRMWTLNLDNNVTYESVTEFAVLLGAWEQQEMQQVLSYAQECYPGSNFTAGNAQVVQSRAPTSNCDFYSTSTINWTTSYPTTCPFENDACLGNDVIQFDTGFLDTSYDLGINDKEEDRLHFRHITTCAPLDQTNFSSQGFINSTWGDVATYNYGLNLVLPNNYGWKSMTETEGSDITFVYPYSSYQSPAAPYYLQVASTMNRGITLFGPTLPTFFPRSDLVGNNQRPVSLFFLANRALFTSPVHDPWFDATEEVNFETLNLGNVTMYRSQQPGNIIGCTDEVQLRNPNNGRTLNVDEMMYTGLFSWYNLTGSNITTSLGLSPHQEALASQVVWSVLFSTMESTLEIMGPRALSANDYLTESVAGTFSSPLSTKQWQVEFSRFQAISMAALQRHRFVMAAGPANKQLFDDFIPYTPEFDWICTSQKFRSTQYASYSSVGIGLIFGLGGLIIISSLIITLLVPCLQRRTGRGMHRRNQWHTNDTLYLQASLLAAKGLGTWTTTPIDETPRTVSGEKFEAYTGSLVEGIDEESSYPHEKLKTKTSASTCISDISDIYKESTPPKGNHSASLPLLSIPETALEPLDSHVQRFMDTPAHGEGKFNSPQAMRFSSDSSATLFGDTSYSPLALDSAVSAPLLERMWKVDDASRGRSRYH